MFEGLLQHWGYLAIAIGTLCEGETVLMAGSAMAHHGKLRLPLVGAVACAGAVGGDLLWFALGRRYGRAFIDKRPKLQQHAATIQAGITRFGALFVFGFRFMYGIRTATPVLLGASGYPLRKFFWLNLLGGMVWTAVFLALGWGLGSGLAGLLGRRGHLVEIIAAAGLSGAVLWLAYKAVSKPFVPQQNEVPSK